MTRKSLVPILTTALVLSAALATAGTDGKGTCKVAAKNCCKKDTKMSAAKAGARKTRKAATSKAAPGTASMRVVVDKATGELRAPNAEEAKALASQDARLNGVDLNESSEGLTVVHHPNGMQSVNLEGRFMSSSVAKIGADGKIIATCVHSEKEKTMFLERKEAPKPVLDVE